MKIETVKAFKYDGQLFENRKQVSCYIKQKKEQQEATIYAKEQLKLKKPESFYIKEGYFEFLLIHKDYDVPEKSVCYKTKSFNTAVNKLLKRKCFSNVDVESEISMRIDYEAEVLDKNKSHTGVYINITDMPEDHEIHRYIA